MRGMLWRIKYLADNLKDGMLLQYEDGNVEGIGENRS